MCTLCKTFPPLESHAQGCTHSLHRVQLCRNTHTHSPNSLQPQPDQKKWIKMKALSVLPHFLLMALAEVTAEAPEPQGASERRDGPNRTRSAPLPTPSLPLSSWLHGGCWLHPFLSFCPQKVRGLHMPPSCTGAYCLGGSSGFLPLQNSWLTYKCLVEEWRTRVHFWGRGQEHSGRREARKGQKGNVPFRFQTVTQSTAPGGWAASPEAPFSGVAALSLPVLRNSRGWALPGLWREAGDLWGLCRDVSALSSVCFMPAVTPVTHLKCPLRPTPTTITIHPVDASPLRSLLKEPPPTMPWKPALSRK